MRLIKIFMAGITFPSILLPCFIILFFENSQILTIPFIHFIPVIWGIWNILYVKFFVEFFPGNSNLKLLISGAVLGLLIASYAVYVLNIPSLLEWPTSFTYIPLFIGPILYVIFWLFIVHPLNQLVGVYDHKKRKQK